MAGTDGSFGSSLSLVRKPSSEAIRVVSKAKDSALASTCIPSAGAMGGFTSWAFPSPSECDMSLDASHANQLTVSQKN